MVQNDWYSKGLPSHVTLPCEYQTPILSGDSDESGIQVFSIQMITVSVNEWNKPICPIRGLFPFYLVFPW